MDLDFILFRYVRNWENIYKRCQPHVPSIIIFRHNYHTRENYTRVIIHLHISPAAMLLSEVLCEVGIRYQGVKIWDETFCADIKPCQFRKVVQRDLKQYTLSNS